jgi:cellulose biosynthesis protein BcsQ
MPVIAVINRKGGSGKSTMATHLAAWLARHGAAVMLGDVDRQQSTRTWLKRRSPELPGIAPWTIDQKNVLKVPVGVTHVVLDTPGGLHGFELAKVVMAAHAILIPVCNSVFDRESAAACIAELMALPRLASGRCQIGVVGMRIDARTRAADTLREWAEGLNLPFLGVLRETQIYVRSLDSGQTIFDMRSTNVQSDLDQWEPILQWLQPVTQLPPTANVNVSANTQAHATTRGTIHAPTAPPLSGAQLRSTGAISERVHSPRAPSLMPAQESLVHGSRLSVFSSASIATRPS